jgi:hypothetical protein
MSSLREARRSLTSSLALGAKVKLRTRQWLGGGDMKYLLKILSASHEVGGIDKISSASIPVRDNSLGRGFVKLSI